MLIAIIPTTNKSGQDLSTDSFFDSKLAHIETHIMFNTGHEERLSGRFNLTPTPLNRTDNPINIDIIHRMSAHKFNKISFGHGFSDDKPLRYFTTLFF